MVITGASGALGRAVVQAFADQGDQVAAIVRRPVADLPDGAHQIAAGDLANPASARSALGDAAAALGGGIDALVHLVGGFEWSTVEQSSPETWRRLFSDNVETTLGAVQAGLPWIGDGGTILCVGAASAEPAGAGMAPYAAAKSGVARIVEALASELKPRGIRVNAILPSIIDTPRNRADMPDADPAGWTTPAAIADVALFLASAQARAISGVLIPVTHNG
nr:SDR family oxidoreductase [Croceibacterium ferulae]